MTPSNDLHARDAEQLSEVLHLVVSGKAASRVELAATTGRSASTITQRVNRLVDAGLLVDDGFSDSRGGRKPSVLKLSPDAGVVLAAVVGATTCRYAVMTLDGKVLAEDDEERDADNGPDPALATVVSGFRRLLDQLPGAPKRVLAVSVGVASAVDPGTGHVVRPLMRIEWDGFDIAGAFAESFPGIPVLAHNDADLMALGEHAARGAVASSMVFVKVGTGIGCGVIEHGRLVVGATGAAGDIGHVRIPGHDDARCNCGKTGCLTAVASGRAIAEHLTALGLPAHNGRDVVHLVRSGNLEARHAVRAAALDIGAVVAMIVGFQNPDLIVIGGLFGHLSEDLLTDIRSAVYGQAQPLATRDLSIEPAVLGDRAGLVGAAVAAADHLLSPAGVGALVAP